MSRYALALPCYPSLTNITLTIIRARLQQLYLKRVEADGQKGYQPVDDADIPAYLTNASSIAVTRIHDLESQQRRDAQDIEALKAQVKDRDALAADKSGRSSLLNATNHTPCQYINTHSHAPLATHYQHTLSSPPLTPPSQHILSTHSIITPPTQPILSTHPLTPPPPT